MRILFLLLSLVAVCYCVSDQELSLEEWKVFKLTHKKEYANAEEEKLRFEIFRDNKHMIAQHNQRFLEGEASFEMAVNQFADLLNIEFTELMNGYDVNNSRLHDSRVESPATFITPANVMQPRQVDWRTQGAVTPVKNQGQCGSGWAFASTGALEGQHFRSTGKLVSLSEQNLIDCSRQYGNKGCRGGRMDRSFQYIKDNQGIDTEDTYPYKGIADKCHYNPKNSGATDRGFVNIPQGSEKKLMEAITTIGPVSVAIDASLKSFQQYSKGIYFDKNCSTNKLSHAMLAVGYGTDRNGQEYWLVKNSWGTAWGDKGYIKMARNKNNHCGIATFAIYPLV